MKSYLLSVSCGFACAASALTFPLEWNVTYRTDVPYEIEISPDKLGAEKFTVFAVKGERVKGERVKGDGVKGERVKGERVKGEEEVPLETTVFRGKLPGTIALHFNVPAGTKELRVEGERVKGERVKG